MKPTPVQAFGIRQLMEAAKRKQAEFDALPPEEQERRRKIAAEALAKLRGQPGFSEIYVRGKK